MYSSVFGGVVTDPALMVIPLDDHMVHRGDGIFDAFKCINGYIYNLDAHLTRLQKSAELVWLELPFDIRAIKQIVIETVAIGGKKDCSVRIFVSRGLGGFACSPKQCHKSNLYVVVLEPEIVPEHFYAEGLSAITSQIPVKPSFFAQAKTCNYLPNVLMEMEAERRKAQFTIALDEQGYIAEMPIENVAIVTKQQILKYPKFDRILKGTSLLRGIELSEELVRSGHLKGICQENITPGEAYKSSEILVFSTAWNVISAVKYDGRIIGNGKPGPVFDRLYELFQKDVTKNEKILTPVFER